MILFKNILSEIKLSGNSSRPTLIKYDHEQHDNLVYVKDKPNLIFVLNKHTNWILFCPYDDTNTYEIWLKDNNIDYEFKNECIMIRNFQQYFNISSHVLNSIKEIKLSGDKENKLRLEKSNIFDNVYYIENTNLELWGYKSIVWSPELSNIPSEFDKIVNHLRQNNIPYEIKRDNNDIRDVFINMKDVKVIRTVDR